MNLDLNNNLLWGMVFYTDGGCRPNPGPAGSGGHGYFYEIEEQEPSSLSDAEVNAKIKSLINRNPEMKTAISGIPKAKLIEMAKASGYFIKPAKGKPIKFTDGSGGIVYAMPCTRGYSYCAKDGTPSSAVDKDLIPVTIKHVISMVESSSNQHTNNYAEMKAVHNALTVALANGAKRLHIVADSEYTIQGLTKWCQGWIERDWTTRQGEEIKNKELWQALYSMYTQARSSGMAVTMSWIKGHRSHPGNDHADHLATIGVMKSMKGIDDLDVKIFTPKEYWEPKRDRHPLLSLKRMYFNREAERNTPGVYYMADPGKDDTLIGKPMPESVFAVVRMKEPVPLIQAIWDAQSRYGQDFNATMMMKMEDVYDPYVFRLVSDYGPHALLRAPSRNPGQPNQSTHLVLPDKRQVTIEKTPIGITMRAIDSINSLEGILDQFLLIEQEGEDSIHNNTSLQIHDLTDDFYDSVEKKVQGEVRVSRVLKKDIIVGQKTFSVTRDIGIKETERTLTLPLRLGMDLPDRNSLKQLEVFNPSVKLITWKESSNSLRYAAVLKCDEGIAIWSNFYADRLMFKGK